MQKKEDIVNFMIEFRSIHWPLHTNTLNNLIYEFCTAHTYSILSMFQVHAALVGSLRILSEIV